MKSRRNFAVVALLVLSSQCRGDEAQKARFQKEYPAAAERLRERFSRVKGSCQLWHTTAKKAKSKRPAEAEFAFDQGREKVEIRSYSVPDPKRPAPAPDPKPSPADDPHYTFVYSLSTPDKTLLHLIKAPGAKEYKVQGRSLDPYSLSEYVDLFARFPRASTDLIGTPISQWMTNPGFRLIDASGIVKGGRKLIKVDFESGTAAPKFNASLVFDPNEGWIIRSGEYGVGALDEDRTTFDVTYGPPRDGVLLPRLVSFRDTQFTFFCEFLDWQFEPTPAEEFQMSHFGHRDLPATGKKRSYVLTYWLAGGAVAVLVVALAVRRIANPR